MTKVHIKLNIKRMHKYSVSYVLQIHFKPLIQKILFFSVLKAVGLVFSDVMFGAVQTSICVGISLNQRKCDSAMEQDVHTGLQDRGTRYVAM